MVQRKTCNLIGWRVSIREQEAEHRLTQYKVQYGRLRDSVSTIMDINKRSKTDARRTYVDAPPSTGGVAKRDP